MDLLVKFKFPREEYDDRELTEQKMLALQYEIINDWKKKKETDYLINGPPALGIVGALCGIYVNSYYRRKLKLRSFGRGTSYLPIVVLPALVAPVVHKVMIQSHLLLRQYDCPVCIQIRAGLLQAAVAGVYPAILAPLASFMFATRHFTYKLPSITQSPMEVFQLWKKLTRPIALPLLGICFGNYLFGMYITSRQIEDFHSIMIQVDKATSRLESGLDGNVS
ncbi:transmembrane protein 126A [Phlebotomus argentipes]|uniref:transmembrane protein 126A n=1 Tax=Phlebotomus argentipes TaxID=94469 RepID=UPI002892B85A|nr:transmembrane protein 126A [Phlebotomus argentipes]